MENLFERKTNVGKLVLGGIVLGLGFYLMMSGIIPRILTTYTLLIGGLLAFVIGFGTDSLKDLFLSKPRKPVKNFLLYYVLVIVTSFASAMIYNLVVKAPPSDNPVTFNQISAIIGVPFQLMGEELMGFFILFAVANLFKYRGNQQALLIGTLVSGLIFGLAHYTTYFDGHVLLTLFHVFIMQGVSRLVFNQAGLKSNTIIVPFLIHLGLDLIGFFSLLL